MFCLVAILFIFSCTIPANTSNSNSSQPSSNTASSQSSSIQGLVLSIGFDNSNQDSSYQNFGATTAAGITGNGLKFDGNDNYLLVANNNALNLNTTGSIEVWINANSFNWCAGLVHKGQNTDFSDEAYTLQFWPTPTDSTIIIGLTNNNGTLLMLPTTSQLNTNQWYQIVATWDSNTVNIYINGVLNNSTPNTIGSVRDSSGGLVIGAQLSQQYDAANGNLGFNGTMDNVNLFNRALSASEIMDRYSKLQ